jgi:hypothetical protein
MKYDLFISHSSADAEAAVALVNEIESRGIRQRPASGGPR